MSKYLLWVTLICCWLPLFDAFPKKEDHSGEEALRIMSYNIRNGRGMDDVADLDRVAAAIQRVDPDVVAVQEVDSVTRRSGGTDVLRKLADEVSMCSTYASAISFDGGKYGVGVLSKAKPLAFHSVPLPGREEERVLLWVEFEDYIFCCTHLSLTPEDQMLSLSILRKEVAKARKPLFLAGDWNACPDSPLIGDIQRDFQLLSDTDQLTFPASEPDRCLDYIAGYSKGGHSFNVRSAWVPGESVASDHRPVVVEVTF